MSRCEWILDKWHSLFAKFTVSMSNVCLTQFGQKVDSVSFGKKKQKQKQKNTLFNSKLFSKNSRAVSRTTEPNISLFKLISMQFSCWIQIWQWKFEFWNFLKKIGRKCIYVERVNCCHGYSKFSQSSPNKLRTYLIFHLTTMDFSEDFLLYLLGIYRGSEVTAFSSPNGSIKNPTSKSKFYPCI